MFQFLACFELGKRSVACILQYECLAAVADQYPGIVIEMDCRHDRVLFCYNNNNAGFGACVDFHQASGAAIVEACQSPGRHEQ